MRKLRSSWILLILIAKKNYKDFASLITARDFGDASGMQVSRYVRLVHGKDLLDAAAEFPRGRR